MIGTVGFAIRSMVKSKGVTKPGVGATADPGPAHSIFGKAQAVAVRKQFPAFVFEMINKSTGVLIEAQNIHISIAVNIRNGRKRVSTGYHHIVLAISILLQKFFRAEC